MRDKTILPPDIQVFSPLDGQGEPIDRKIFKPAPYVALAITVWLVALLVAWFV